MVTIKVQKLSEEAVMPKYAHEGDAGMDLFSIENYTVKPSERVLVKTGLKTEIPEGFEMQIRPKSGLALNSGITVLNTPGTIDAGYRGEIGVIIINHSNSDYNIAKGQKIAQAVFARFEKAEIQEVSETSDSSRAKGGFGSTGLNKK